MSRADKSIEAFGVVQLLAVLKALKKQLKATKRLYFRHRGVVTDRRVLPDHKAQLRAAIELVKMHDLYPRRGEREATDLFDRSERPVINLVILGTARSNRPTALTTSLERELCARRRTA